jgi:phosphorylcholine metabolism protein LicD
MLLQEIFKTEICPGDIYEIKDKTYKIQKKLKFTDKQYALSKDHLDSLYDLLKTLTEIFEENDIPLIAIAGTLLSAIRHKTFMNWDEDIDMAYHINDHLKIKRLVYQFLLKGYNLLDCGSGFVVQNILKPHIAADLFSLCIKDNKYIYGKFKNNKIDFFTSELFPKEWYYKNEIDNLSYAYICGIKVSVPSNSKNILKRIYSENVFKEVRGVSSTKIHFLRNFQIIQAVLEGDNLIDQICRNIYKEIILN